MFHKIKKEKWISFLCIAALVLVTAPLLILGHYDYPSADDWALGQWTYQAIKEKGGFIGICKAIARTILHWRQAGEPRFASVTLGALQPGIFGEHFYRITPYLMIGSLIFSEFLLGNWLLYREQKGGHKWTCPILIPSLILQIMYVPYPTETFYWYEGAVNYTFVFGLSLILVYLFFRLLREGTRKKDIFIFEALSILMAILIGGNNYSTSLSTACLFVSLSFIYFWKNRNGFWRTLPITVTVIVSLLISAMSSGNQVRLNDSFGGGNSYGVLQSVWMSITRTCVNIYSWSRLKIILMVLLILPFLWMALRESSFHFKKPALFTLFTLGIYASQITANMYVEGGISACRIADILYYGYHVWLLLNIGYWIGWIQRLESFNRLNPQPPQFILWFCVTGLILMITCGITDIKTTSTYRACAWLGQGTAKQYAEEWEKRLAILHDDSVRYVEFEPLPMGAEMVLYTDFTPDIPWLGEVCAEYYNKDYVGLAAP